MRSTGCLSLSLFRVFRVFRGLSSFLPGIVLLFLGLSAALAQDPAMGKGPMVPGINDATRPGEDYRRFFKKPTTSAEFWAAMQFELDIGKYDLAAGLLHGMLALKPTEAELVQIHQRDGMASFLKLRLLREWVKVPPFDEKRYLGTIAYLEKINEDVNKIANLREQMHKEKKARADAIKLNEEANKDVEELIKLVTTAVKNHLRDPVRINKWVQHLKASPEERVYALKELYASGALVVPYLLKDAAPLLRRGSGGHPRCPDQAVRRHRATLAGRPGSRGQSAGLRPDRSAGQPQGQRGRPTLVVSVGVAGLPGRAAPQGPVGPGRLPRRPPVPAAARQGRPGPRGRTLLQTRGPVRRSEGRAAVALGRRRAHPSHRVGEQGGGILRRQVHQPGPAHRSVLSAGPGPAAEHHPGQDLRAGRPGQTARPGCSGGPRVAGYHQPGADQPGAGASHHRAAHGRGPGLRPRPGPTGRCAPRPDRPLRERRPWCGP